MTMREWGVRALSVVVCVASAACGGSDSSSGSGAASGEDSEVISYVENGFGAARTAFDHPSAQINAASMPRILESIRESKKSAAYGSGVGGVPSTGGTSTASIDPLTVNYQACMTRAGALLSVDMGCMTEGKVTGTETVRAAHASSGTYMVIRMINICLATSSTGCMDGESLLFMPPDGSSMETKQDVTIATEKGPFHVKSVTLTTLKPTLSSRTLANDGEDYVVIESGGVYGDSGSITLTGANGTFSCKFSASGGSCTQDGATFTW